MIVADRSERASENLIAAPAPVCCSRHDPGA
jgi:hypothetical protein